MASSSFEELRDSADATISTLRSLIPRIQAGTKDEQKAANLESARLLKKIEITIKSMENEARGSAPSQRRGQQDRIAEVKQELNSVRQSIQKANDAASRADLMAGKQPINKAEMDARDRMVDTMESATRGTMKLQQTQNLLMESQDIGSGILDTMGQQRETIVRATNKTTDVNTLTKTARGILRGIQARAITNKVILFATILVMLGCIGIVVYFGYIHDPKGK